MLRNIYHHYPVKLLPPDLSEGFEPEMTVTVTIETEGDFAKDLIGLECVYEFRVGQIVKLSERSFQL
jgi:hypothetical protein